MAEVTTTRAELRRAIGMLLGMPFYTYYGTSGLTPSGTPTTTLIPCSSLYQADDRWNYGMLYSPELDEFREITDFSSSGIEVTYPFTTAPSSSENIEIITKWSVPEIHMAINRAIEYGRRHFPTVSQDTSIVITEDTVEYDLSSISDTIWFLLQVEMENCSTYAVGTASSGGADTLVVPDSFGLADDEYNTYYISIYEGTGSGQIRTILDCVDATNTIQVTENWTTNPDSTSRFRIWTTAVNEQETVWERLANYKLNKEEYPTTLRLLNDHHDNYGLRIRLTYAALPATLSAETDTTTVPKEFITLKALAYLYEMKLNVGKVDEPTYRRLSDRYHEQAEAYIEANHLRLPQMMIRNPVRSYPSKPIDNPLGW